MSKATKKVKDKIVVPAYSVRAVGDFLRVTYPNFAVHFPIRLLRDATIVVARNDEGVFRLHVHMGGDMAGSFGAPVDVPPEARYDYLDAVAVEMATLISQL